MIRYTTPLLPLEVEGVDLTGDNDVYVTMVQDRVKLTKTGSELTISYDSEKDMTTINLGLTQKESASFDLDSPVLVQVNFINAAQVRDATSIAKIPVMRNLLDKEIRYGDQA